MASSGRHRWELGVEGDNYVVIGLVGDGVDVSTWWEYNSRCWGVCVWSRTMLLARQEEQRGAGPDRFQLPCVVLNHLSTVSGKGYLLLYLVSSTHIKK